MRAPVEVAVSTACRDGKAGLGVVIRTPGEPARVIARATPATSRVEAAYRAMVVGLLQARRTGARAVRLRVDSAEAVEQAGGRAEVPPELIGLYLQTRALLNAYRWSRVEYAPRPESVEAVRAAVEALDHAPVALDPEIDPLDSLPLFSVRS